MFEVDEYKLLPGVPNNEVDIKDWFLKNSPEQTYYYIPQLIYKIHLTTKASINFISQEIIRFYETNREIASLDRTSLIFITGRYTRGGRIEKRRLQFYPVYRESHISHLRLREKPKEIFKNAAGPI